MFDKIRSDKYNLLAENVVVAYNLQHVRHDYTSDSLIFLHDVKFLPKLDSGSVTFTKKALDVIICQLNAFFQVQNSHTLVSFRLHLLIQMMYAWEQGAQSFQMGNCKNVLFPVNGLQSGQHGPMTASLGTNELFAMHFYYLNEQSVKFFLGYQ